MIELTDDQLRVLKELGRANERGAAGMSDEKLAKRLNMTVEEVHRHLRLLIEVGFIDHYVTPVPKLPKN